jgi:lysophospholipase L1-like esterase
VLLIAPPPLEKMSGEVAAEFVHGLEKSKQFASLFRTVAEESHCEFFDASSVIRTSDVDGVHFDADEHCKLGVALSQFIGSKK